MTTICTVFRTLMLFLIPIYSRGFVHKRLPSQVPGFPPVQYHFRRSRIQHLVPLREFNNEVTFLKQEASRKPMFFDEMGQFTYTKDGSSEAEVFEICVVDSEDDLTEVAELTVRAFGAEAIRVSNQDDWTAMERMIVKPAAELINGYSALVAFAEVLGGLRSRMHGRFNKPNGDFLAAPHLSGETSAERISEASQNSVVLVLTHAPDSKSSNVMVSTVELRLQPCDAKIPFSFPWIDKVERRLASFLGHEATRKDTSSPDLQPYLSNLCVHEDYRGRGIGRAMVRCVENIASSRWKYDRLYLHVDIDNKRALKLYQSEGYNDVGQRWNPFWAGKASDIGYFIKIL